MNPKTFISKTTSVVASIVLAIGGSLVATQPANAAFDPQAALNFQSVTRGNAQISGNNVTDSVAIQTGEYSWGYTLNAEYASGGSPYTVTTALSSSNKPTLSFAATSGGTAVPVSTSNVNWFIEYWNGNGYTQWDPYTGATIPTGSYTVFRIYTSGQFSSRQIGPKTVDVTLSISVNGSALTPLSFQTGNPTGLNVNTPANTLSYTPVANDKQLMAMFRACIWVPDQSGIVTGDSVQISATNTVTNSNLVGNVFPNIYNNGNNVSVSQNNGVKSFTIPASSTLIEAQVQVNVDQITVGDPISLSISAQKDGTGTNMLDSCNKLSSASAVSPTVTGNGTTTTISWVAPSDLVASGYSQVRVLACTTALANCATLASVTSMMTSGFSFSNSSALNLNATTFTAASNTMMGSGTWSASTAYKYAVVYSKSGAFNPNWLNVMPGNVWIAGPSAATSASTSSNNQQQNNNVTAVVERSIPTPVFQAPILNSLAPKLTSGFSSNGGRLVMKDVKPADIASVMLNGKKVEVVASKSGAALRIPAGSGAGDLTFTMADGSVITVANAVKISQSAVDPKAVPLNSLPKFTGSSVAVPKAVKTAITKTKKIILESESAKCVGYASSNTVASKAVALARASNVCGVISDINENIEPIVKVLVNKTIAKKSPVRYLTW